MEFITSNGGNKFEIKENKSDKLDFITQYKATKPLIYEDGKIKVWSIHEEM